MTRAAVQPTSDKLPDLSRRHAWIRPLILVAVLVVFAPICRHAFVAWDDDYTIEQNPRMQHPSAQTLLHYWRHGFMDLYVPVTYTVWTGLAMASKAIGRAGWKEGLDPLFFHAASVAVHAINALLVYSLLRRLLRTPWPAAGGALLFALHPVQVETVAWTSGMKDLLCGMFSLLALNQYVCAVEPDAPGAEQASEKRRRVHYAIGMAAMLLGMLSKPTAMVTPLLATVIDLLLLRRPWRRVLISVAPYFLLAIPCMIWTKLCQPARFLREVPLWHRGLVAADALAFYLCKLVFPAHLTYDYGRAPWTIFQKHWAWFTWLLPAAVAAGLFVYRRRTTPLTAAAILLVVGVAPVLGFTSFDFEMISTVADHYLYLAMLGPALAAAWALAYVRAKPQRLAVATSMILALLAARSADQVRHWQNSRTFFMHAIELNPESWSSWYGLAFVNHMEGRELATQATAEAGQGLDAMPDRVAANELLNAALECYRRTIEINVYDVAAHHGYATMLMYFGRHEEAAREFLAVVRLRDSLGPASQPNYYVDNDLLGQCLLYCGRADEAANAFRAALLLQPAPPEAAAHLKVAENVLAARRAPLGPTPPGPAVTDVRKEEAPAGN